MAEDLTTLVEQFVRGSIRRPQDTLGTRRVDISYSDVQEAAAGLFLLYPQASFYVLFLACQRLNELVVAEEEVVKDIQRLLFATGRNVTPIRDLTPLNNITSALQELERAIGERSQAFKNIEEVPAFKRFDDNVQRFLEAAGRNVKDDGELIETPQEARSRLPALVKGLREAHAEISRKATLIRNGLSNYASINLPALAASGVISRSRSVLATRTSSLQAANETGRLEQNKDAVLELLASRAVVRKFGSFRAPFSVFEGNQTATPFIDAAHPSTPAKLQADFPTSIPVSGNNVLDFYLNRDVPVKFDGTVDSIGPEDVYGIVISASAGNFTSIPIVVGDIVYVTSTLNRGTRWVVTSVTSTQIHGVGLVEVLPETSSVQRVQVVPAPDESISLLNAKQVKIDGLAVEPFRFYLGDANNADNNRIALNGYNVPTHVLPGTLTVSWSDTPLGDFIQDINQKLNTAWGGSGPQPVILEPYFSPAAFDGSVTVSVVSGSTYRATVVFGDLVSAGVESTGWYIRFMTGGNITRMFRVIAVDPSATPLYVDFESVLIVPTLGVARVQIGTRPKVRVTYGNQYGAVRDQLSLNITKLDASAFPTLGISTGRVDHSFPLRADVVAADIASKSKLVTAEVFQDVLVTCSGRSLPLQPTQVTLFKVNGVGDLVASGVDVTVTTDADLSTVVVGDKVVFRDSDPVNANFTVTALVAGGFTATSFFAVPVASGTGVTFDIGDAALPLNFGNEYTLNILGTSNSGSYACTGTYVTNLEAVVSPALPERQDLNKQPVEFPVTLSKDYVFLKARDTRVGTTLVVHGSFVNELFINVLPKPPTAKTVAETTWLQLESIPTGLQVGDKFEYYATDYKTPSQVGTILSIDFGYKLLELDFATPIDRTYTVSQAQTVPFALLRVAQVLSTNGLEDKLQEWLDRPENQDAFFVDLNRFINPLLINENPTVVQVADAEARLMDLYKYLTPDGAGGLVDSGLTLSAILGNYSIDVLDPMDTLIRTYTEKGADRALDILLEANFSGFFGLDMDESSYAGDMLKKMRELAREDLPVRKTDRVETQQSQMLAQTDDEDFEYSGSDVENGGVPSS